MNALCVRNTLLGEAKAAALVYTLAVTAGACLFAVHVITGLDIITIQKQPIQPGLLTEPLLTTPAAPFYLPKSEPLEENVAQTMARVFSDPYNGMNVSEFKAGQSVLKTSSDVASNLDVAFSLFSQPSPNDFVLSNKVGKKHFHKGKPLYSVTMLTPLDKLTLPSDGMLIGSDSNFAARWFGNSVKRIVGQDNRTYGAAAGNAALSTGSDGFYSQRPSPAYMRPGNKIHID